MIENIQMRSELSKERTEEENQQIISDISNLNDSEFKKKYKFGKWDYERMLRTKERYKNY